MGGEKEMVKFSPYFYKFKDMLLNRNIPIELRSKFLIEKEWSDHWRKMYKYNMYTDDSSINYNTHEYGYWENYLAWRLKKVSIKDVSSILDMDLKNPEISPDDLVVALILWGRGTAIVKKVIELTDVDEREEFLNLLKEANSWRKEKKLLRDPGWEYH